MALAVVLLGPPGSGKSTIGQELGQRGFRWREWEIELRERYGGRETFLDRKAEALEWLARERTAWARAGEGPAVLESTGLSDAPFLDGLAAEGTFVVLLDVSPDRAEARIDGRARGGHLTDGLEANRRTRAAFEQDVRSARAVHIVIDTGAMTAAEAALQIASAFAEWAKSRA